MILNCNCTCDINLTKLFLGLKEQKKIAEKIVTYLKAKNVIICIRKTRVKVNLLQDREILKY